MAKQPKHDTPLRRWRLSRSLTQAELAQRCGVHQRTIARYETDDRAPHRFLATIQRVTHLSYMALLDPVGYLLLHPHFLAEYASLPNAKPGRPRRKRPPQPEA